MTSAVGGRATQADGRFVPTNPTGGAKRTGRQQFGTQRGTIVSDGGEGEKYNPTAKLLWPLGTATLGAQQFGAQRGAMVTDGRAEEEEKSNSTAMLLWRCGQATFDAHKFGAQRGAMTTGGDAGREEMELDVVDGDEARDLPASVAIRKKVPRGAMSATTRQRTISTRQHPI